MYQSLKNSARHTDMLDIAHNLQLYNIKQWMLICQRTQ